MRNHARPIILFALTLASLLLAPAMQGAHAAPTYTPGVKPGDMAVYSRASGSWGLGGPPQPPFSQFIELNYTTLQVTSVTGENVTAAQTFVYANKTSVSDTIQGSVATDSGNITFWFIAANLTAGDPIYTTPNAPVINQTFTQAFAGAPRTVDAFNLTQTPSPGVVVFVNVWWDQATGILLLIDYRVTTPTGSASFFASLVETNIWSPGPTFGMYAQPDSLTVQLGSSENSVLYFVSQQGFSGSIAISYALSCFSLCPTVTITPSTVFLDSGGQTFSNVTIAASLNGTATGSYSITFIAVSGSILSGSTVFVTVVGPTTTTFLSNDPNSPGWTIDSPVWTLNDGVLDGNGLTGYLSPKILSTARFSSDRTVELDFRTVTAGDQPYYTAWIIGKYADFYEKTVLQLSTSHILELDVRLGDTIHYYFANTTFSPNQWLHAKLVFTGNNARAYINGTLYINVTDPMFGGLGNGPISLASWGNSESEFNNVTVVASVAVDEPPRADFYATPQPATTGQPVFFNASPSIDPDGYITSYDWSFGDGFIGFGEFPTHVYNGPGNYTVTLTVTDNAGLTASAGHSITVIQPIMHDVGIVNIYTSPSVAVSGQPVLVNVGLVNLGQQPETVDLTVYEDSQVATTVNGISIPVTQYPYYFGALWDTSGVAPGNYTISATIFLSTDQNPANNQLTNGQVTILPPPVLVATPTSGPVGTKVTVHGSGFPVSGIPVGFPVTVDVTFDDQFVGFTTMTNSTFNFTFNIPLAQPGPHQIHAYVQFYPSQAEAAADFTVTPTPPTGALTLTISAGTIYFPGDTATIYLLSSLNSSPSQAQTIHLTLLLPNGTARTLTLTQITPGLYQASYKVPATGSIGTYALVATAQINNLNATALGSFEVKPTWIQSNGRNVATATAIVGAVGTVSVLGIGWRKGYFTKRKDEFPIP